MKEKVERVRLGGGSPFRHAGEVHDVVAMLHIGGFTPLGLIAAQRPGIDPQPRSDLFAQLAGVEGPGSALAQLPKDIGQIGFLKALTFTRRRGAGW